VMQQHYKSPPVVQGPGLVDVPVTKPISGGAVASIKDAELHIDSRIRSPYIRQGNFRSGGFDGADPFHYSAYTHPPNPQPGGQPLAWVDGLAMVCVPKARLGSPVGSPGRSSCARHAV
jgi:hypothetical protein